MPASFLTSVNVDARRNAYAKELMQKGSWVIVGLYGVAVLYRSGVVSSLLPKSVARKLEGAVNALKEKTEPLEATKVHSTLRKHLLETYGLTGVLWASTALGSLAFFRYPYIPIGLPLCASVVPGALVMITNPAQLRAPVRILSALVSSFSLGYCFGPMNWIAYDTLGPFASVVGSTVAGFGVGLYLTRGTISYFLSSQLLSLSLSICSTSLLLQAHGAARVNAEVNSMLTCQLLCNFALGLLHTIPTVARLSAPPEALHPLERGPSREEQGPSPDPIKEGMLIYGAFCYATWWVFRQLTARLLRRIAREEAFAMTPEERRRVQGWSLSGSRRLDRLSDIGGGVVLLLIYVKAVSHVQNAGAQKHLNHVRKLFQAASPIAWL